MPQMQYGTSAFVRARGDLPELPLVNMFVETAPTEEAPVLQSRPGLSNRSVTMGSGPVEQVYYRDGVLDSALYGVSDSALYREAVSLGAIDGTGPVSMDGYENLLFTAAGASLWGYDGSSLAAIAMPNGENVIKVLVGASRAIAIPESGETFYWSPALTGTFDGLDFASAETRPDRLLDGLFIDDILVLFGKETVEFWPNTQDADLPFTPLEQRVFEKGIRATGCAAVFDSSFAWLGNDNVVYVNGQSPAPISEPGLNEKIAASTNARVYTFTDPGGQEHLAVRLDSETWAFGARSQRWSQMVSYGTANWLPQCWSGGVFGSGADGKTLAWGNDWLDLGGPMERRFRGGFPLNGGSIQVDNIVLRTNPGTTTYLTGTYADPAVEMRVSRDLGHTWGAWRRVTLGERGNYRKAVRWTACGRHFAPGFLAEFRCTDPVDWRVSNVLVNERYA